MHATTIIHNISKLFTSKGPYQRGQNMNDIMIVEEAFIAIHNDQIIGIGTGSFKEFLNEDTITFDAAGSIALPGFIDGHTHLVHGGSREHEFAKKIEGVPYLEILKSGGGILSTVKSTREATVDELYEKAKKSLYEIGSFGVTTIEAKSGYGLQLDTEIKQLEVARLLQNDTPFDIVSTYLGAHAYPTEYLDKKEMYVEQIKQDIEVISNQKLATYIDVFCEDHVFDLATSKDILEHGKRHGLQVKIHADEIVSLGGAKLAVELNASSADHLMAASKEDITLLGKSNTVANILPMTSFYLNKEYADVRYMIEQNCIVGLCSDYNPGSSPSENFQLMTQIAASKCRMTPNEILTATTINAAYALQLDSNIGSLEVGKKADIVLMDAPNLEYIYYHFGINHTKHIFKNGTLIYQNKRYV